MEFLSDDFYKDLSKDYSERMENTPGALAEKEKNKTNEIFTKPFTDVFNPFKEYFKMAEQPPTVPGVPRPEGGFKIAPTPFATPETPVRMKPEISEEEQIKKFGGVVGSPEYLAKKLEHPYRSFVPMQFGSALGMRFPDIYTWDKMAFSDKANHVIEQTVELPIKLALGLPTFIAKAIPSLVSFVIRPIAEGTLSPEKLAESEKNNPYFLSDPIYTPAYETYKQARDAGRSDEVATVAGFLMGGLDVGTRALMGRGLYTATKSLVISPKRLAPGETVKETAPIQEAITKSKEKLTTGIKDGSASIYLSLDTTTESLLRDNYKVSGGRIWTKITPAAEGKVQISVVQTQGPFQTAGTFLKKKIGINDQEFIRGMKGPEKKLDFYVVEVEAPAMGIEKSTFISKPDLSKLENLNLELTGVEETIKGHPAFSLTKYARNKKTELPEVIGLTRAEKAAGKKVGEYSRRGDELITELGFEDSAQAAESYEQLVRLRDNRKELLSKIKEEKTLIGKKTDEVLERASLDKSIKLEMEIEKSLNKIRETIIEPVPDKSLKGFENISITRKQVENLSNIGRLNGIEPTVQEALIKTLTGKSVVGELTNAEYINIAKNLSTANKLGELGAGGEASLWSKYIGQKVSPAYSWMESVQRRYGIDPNTGQYRVPIEDARIDLVDALRFQKTTQNVYFEKIVEIWGKYARPKYEEYQRLVDAHRRGDAGAIINNLKLSPEVKSDLLKINDEISKYYEEAGPALNVPKEIFKKNEAGYYEPDIADIGGVVPKYKEKGKIPIVGEFFAKQKKEGGMFIQEDNALKLMQIYARSGAYAKYVKPVVDRIKIDVESKVPKEFQNGFASTISEMLGYQGGFERFLDDFSNILNQKLNRKLPPDLGRRVNQATFSYVYVNALDSPGTWARNLVTNEVLLLTEFGGEFWFQVNAEIAKLSFGKSALWKEFQDSGLFNVAGNTYGADIGTIEGTVKNVAETLLKPQSISDNLGRFKAFVYTKLKFENALKLYNEGKLTWQQTEKKMGLNGLSPIVVNRVRSQLLAKNTKAAFEELARNNINETNFPYGRGEGGRLTFGEGGHIATFLAKWNIHFAHNIGRWIRTGQYDKLIRYYVASTAVIKSLQEAVGFDFTRSVYAGPILNTSWPPSVQLGLDLVTGLKLQSMDNAESIDENKDQIATNLKTFGYPGGVDLKNWQTFWRSYNNGPVDAQGRYNIITERGEVAEPQPVYFHDLFWRMMGMPTTSKFEAAKLKKDITNYSYEINQAKRKVAELRNVGKDDEADKIVLEWEAKGEDIEPGEQSYDRFERSATERRFEALSPTGEAKFEERIYK